MATDSIKEVVDGSDILDMRTGAAQVEEILFSPEG